MPPRPRLPFNISLLPLASFSPTNFGHGGIGLLRPLSFELPGQQSDPSRLVTPRYCCDDRWNSTIIDLTFSFCNSIERRCYSIERILTNRSSVNSFRNLREMVGIIYEREFLFSFVLSSMRNGEKRRII